MELRRPHRLGYRRCVCCRCWKISFSLHENQDRIALIPFAIKSAPSLVVVRSRNQRYQPKSATLRPIVVVRISLNLPGLRSYIYLVSMERISICPLPKKKQDLQFAQHQPPALDFPFLPVATFRWHSTVMIRSN